MDSFIYSINATVPIFLVMIVGWVIKQLGVIDEHFVSKANKYVFHVALPVLLFQQISSADMTSQFDIRFVLYCMLATTAFFVITWVVTELLMKDDTQKGSFVQCACRSSAAILGMAFIQNMYSSTGMAPLMIVSAVPLFNIYSVIILTLKAHPEVKTGSVVKKEPHSAVIKRAFINVLKNPIIIGIVLGLPFSLLHVQFPVIINKTLTSIAQTATPIALIVIGAGFEGRKAIKKIKPTVIATFIKLIGIAAVCLPIAVAMGYRNQELVAILIMVASPTTVSCYIMSENMDNDGVLASSIIVLTTLLSSITLTGWIYLLRSMGLI